MIEQAWSTFCGQSDLHPTLCSWLAAIPKRTIRRRPLLCLLEAVLLADHRDFAGAERWARFADEALACSQSTVSEDLACSVRGMVAAIRASFAGLQGRSDEAIRTAEMALRDLPPGNAAFRGTAMLGLGYAAVDQGDLPRATHAFAECLALSRTAASEMQLLAAAVHLAYVQRAQGNLTLALQTCTDALAWVATQGRQSSLLVGLVYVCHADLLRERNELDGALRSARDGVTFCARWPDPTMQALSLLVLARVQLAQGEFDGAADTLARARGSTEVELVKTRTSHAGSDAGGDVRAEDMASLASLLRVFAIQMQLAQGVEVSGWPSDQHGSSSLEWPCSPRGYRPLFQVYTAEHVFIAPAQALLAQAQLRNDAEALRQALARVDELRQHAETLGLRWLEIKAEVLAALAHHALGARSQAVAMLWQALVHAHAEQYVRVFADEGAPLVVLLDQLACQCETGYEATAPLDPAYISLVRTAAAAFAARAGWRSSSASPGKLPRPFALRDPLTTREEEVLRLLADGYSNEEIATALVVAMGTVKAHVQHIYRKLGAHSRTHALARARELQLLPRHDRAMNPPLSAVRQCATRTLADGRR
ncbi:MAG: LuxR C-terminal-related transcriptional regulator [Nitrososphaerota archaeon]